MMKSFSNRSLRISNTHFLLTNTVYVRLVEHMARKPSKCVLPDHCHFKKIYLILKLLQAFAAIFTWEKNVH